MKNEDIIGSSFTLPCGQVLPNRLCKAAMTERLSDSSYGVNDKHLRLYSIWSESQFGLHLSGNIMVDKSHLESAGNIAATDDRIIEELRPLTQLITDKGSQFWAQLNHAGRQTSYLINLQPKSASDVWLRRGGFYAKPRPMKEGEILKVIEDFGASAERCISGGFTGIQIHAAHGYLISQFLSPLTNKRNDHWGGSIENRARLLLSTVSECRERIGPEKAISVKLNSADFQKGGFDESDSMRVIKMLEDKIDLLEISGGTYEKQAMMGEHTQSSTAKREAYFLNFAKKLRQVSNVPLLVTGGFRTRTAIRTALTDGDLDMVGIARPFCTEPEKMNGFLSGEVEKLTDYFKPAKTGFLRFSSEGGYYARQIVLLAEGKKPHLDLSGDAAGRFIMTYEMKKALSKRLFG